MNKQQYPRIMTLGVYGSTEESFFGALQKEGVDLFCDLRRRRGMRGSRYAYVNSTYLQKRLHELKISYWHCLDLAPTTALRQLQDLHDKTHHTTKQARQVLSAAFIQQYKQIHLANFDAAAFVQSFSTTIQCIALFCVEREPQACHRSLVADRIEQELGTQVENILP